MNGSCDGWNRGFAKNFICTIKFKGKPDLSIVDKFDAIPNSRVLHLFQNKNELTWFKLGGPAA